MAGRRNRFTQRHRILQSPLYGEYDSQARTWSHARRVIVKAERLPDQNDFRGKENTRFIVTNLEGKAKELYENVSCARGDMENRIKEQQLMLFADRTSCHGVEANRFRLFLSSCAYGDLASDGPFRNGNGESPV